MPMFNLQSQLSLERALIQQLASCLVSERQALIHMDIETLKQVTEDKVNLLKNIEACIAQRLEAVDLPDEASWDAFIAAQHVESVEIWQNLKTDFNNVVTTSAANALAINAAKARNRQLKELLHHAQDQPNLYNKYGETEGAGSRNLGCA